MTVPSHLLEIHNPEDVNLAPIPDSTRHDDKTHIKPEEVEKTGKADGDTTKPYSQTQYADSGGLDPRLKNTNWRNPHENSPGKGLKWNDDEPGGGNMPKTAESVYLEELKRT